MLIIDSLGKMTGVILLLYIEICNIQFSGHLQIKLYHQLLLKLNLNHIHPQLP